MNCIKKILKFSSGNHLDIGAGSGIFSILFKDKNWSSDALDVTNENLLSKNLILNTILKIF